MYHVYNGSKILGRLARTPDYFVVNNFKRFHEVKIKKINFMTIIQDLKLAYFTISSKMNKE